MDVIPLKDYTLRDGIYNIARFLPNIYCTPDLGPKMYIAYSNANNPDGTSFSQESCRGGPINLVDL